jgi:hypothetical protein
VRGEGKNGRRKELLKITCISMNKKMREGISSRIQSKSKNPEMRKRNLLSESHKESSEYVKEERERLLAREVEPHCEELCILAHRFLNPLKAFEQRSEMETTEII